MEKSVVITASRTVYRGHVFDVVEEQLQYPDGRSFERAIVKHNGAAVFIPQCEDGSVLMVRQYRAALHRFILEFPAGTLEEGEAPLQCAKREISEEVGHAAAEWIELGTLYPSPGICDEVQHCYLARKLRPFKSEGDEDELLEVERVGVGELESLIADGSIADAKTIAIFAQARLKGFL